MKKVTNRKGTQCNYIMIAILNKNSFPHWLNGFRNIICCKNKIRVYSYKKLLKIVVRIDTAIKISSVWGHEGTPNFQFSAVTRHNGIVYLF
jgi:hypothetical protein